MSGRVSTVLDIEPIPGVHVRISGDSAAVSHFRGEYGDRAEAGIDTPTLEITFDRGAAKSEAPTIAGGHKTVGWKAWIPEPSRPGEPVVIAISGHPRWFALSLVQGYIVEPLLSLAGARAGAVLLPAGAVEVGAGAVVLVGRSGSGKSSVCALALAHGRAVLGDDQVVIGADGVRRFPRRMRFYDDLQRTAPQAFGRLPLRFRSGLWARRVGRIATKGVVAPSLAVPAEAIGPVADGPLPVARVVLLERGIDGDRLVHDALDLEDLLDATSQILAAQRTTLVAAGNPSLTAEIARVEAMECACLRRAFAGVALSRLGVPHAWVAPRAVAAVAEAIGITP